MHEYHMATFQVQQRIYGQGTWLIGQMYRWQLALRVSAVLGRSWGLRCRVGGRDPSPSWISPKPKMFLFSQNANGVVTSFAKVLAPVLPLEPINCKLKRGKKVGSIKRLGLAKLGGCKRRHWSDNITKCPKVPPCPLRRRQHWKEVGDERCVQGGKGVSGNLAKKKHC